MSREPMHAGKFVPERLIYPCFAQPKLDGIRGVVNGDHMVSRTWKPIRNRFIQSWVKEHADFLKDFDGELIVGSPTAADNYRVTMSGVTSEMGEPDFKYYVFDICDTHSVQHERLHNLKKRFEEIAMYGGSALHNRLEFVDTQVIHHQSALYEYEQKCVDEGYEGIMTRYIHGIYKHGRATSVSQELLKVKRFLDDEAIIEGFEELYRNENEATENAYGRTVRSSHQAGKVPADTLGALRVRNSAGQSFSVGTGFDFATREEIWKNQAKYLGQRITYKYVKVGGYDVPRFPVFKGFRPEGV